eukprot:1662666-Heterocapsa_arctica.AAC.1
MLSTQWRRSVVSLRELYRRNARSSFPPADRFVTVAQADLDVFSQDVENGESGALEMLGSGLQL